MQPPDGSERSPDDGDDESEALLWRRSAHTGPTTSPTALRRHYSRASDLDLRSRRPTKFVYTDERSSLLEHVGGLDRSYTSFLASISATPRLRASRRQSVHNGTYLTKSHSRSALFSQRLVNALSSNRDPGPSGSLEDSKTSFSEHRVWYDQVCQQSLR